MDEGIASKGGEVNRGMQEVRGKTSSEIRDMIDQIPLLSSLLPKQIRDRNTSIESNLQARERMRDVPQLAKRTPIGSGPTTVTTTKPQASSNALQPKLQFKL